MYFYSYFFWLHCIVIHILYSEILVSEICLPVRFYWFFFSGRQVSIVFFSWVISYFWQFSWFWLISTKPTLHLYLGCMCVCGTYLLLEVFCSSIDGCFLSLYWESMWLYVLVWQFIVIMLLAQLIFIDYP